MIHDFTNLKNNLESKGYTVSVFATKEAATEYLDSQIDEKIVGFGGSVTLQEMNLFRVLSTHNTVYCVLSRISTGNILHKSYGLL